MQQAALALEHAHAMGVVHRDIKPGNLLLDKRGNLWVTDFGLAQFHTDAELTRTGDLLGTLRYMSPEQADAAAACCSTIAPTFIRSGRRCTKCSRSSRFSKGAIATFCCGESSKTIREPPRAIDKNRFPLELETIVLKAIAKSPGRSLCDGPAICRRSCSAGSTTSRFWPAGRRWPSACGAGAGGIARWSERRWSFACLAVLGLAAGAIVIAREHSLNTLNRLSRRQIKQRAAAEESFHQARQAIDTFTQLSEEELADKPPLHQLRRKFLEKSLEYYNAFLKQRGSDPALSSELTATSQRVARIVDELALLDQLAPLMLLYEPRVQDELNIPKERRSEMVSLLTQLSREREQTRSSTRSASRSPPDSRQASVSENLRSHGEKLFALLDQQQLGRLKQIAWQQQGAQAFKSSDIVAALQLTPEERKQIDLILEARRPPSPPERPERRGPGPGQGRGDGPGLDGPPLDGPGRGPPRDRSRRDGPPARLDPPPFADAELAEDGPPAHRAGEDPNAPERERQTVEKILSVLTPEQQAAWKNLVGAAVCRKLCVVAVRQTAAVLSINHGASSCKISACRPYAAGDRIGFVPCPSSSRRGTPRCG